MEHNILQKPWAFSADEVLEALHGSKSGLSIEVIQEKLKTYGPNLLKSKDVEPWYIIFLQQFANPLVYMLIGAAIIKAYFKGPIDATVIAVVLLFMAVVGFVQEFKAQKAMTALLKLSVPKAKVRRNSTISAISAEELVPGDILILDAGDRIAADARLIEAANLKVNESAFTGESLPVEKDNTIVPENTTIHDRTNMVFMGTIISSGRALAIVTATGMQSEIGRIAEGIRETKKEKTPLQQTVENLGHALIWVVLGACTLLAIAGLLRGISWIDVLLLAVAAAVSGIPEGLPASVTVVLSICVSKMAKRNVIIRKLTAVETLGSTTIICTDKTGTLTLNQMTVTTMWVDNHFINVTGSGYEPEGEFLIDGNPTSPDENSHLLCGLTVAALCNDAILNKAGSSWDIIGDPTEGALLAVAGKAGLFKHNLEQKHPRLEEIPFESDKQYMATMHAEGNTNVIFVKGSPERVLSMCKSMCTSEGTATINDSIRNEILDANARMASQALRVLAVATAPYSVEMGKINHSSISGQLVFIGLIGMIDPPREEIRQAIKTCKEAGIRIAMITGDNALTAAAIATQLGICNPGDKAISGTDIEILTDDKLKEICRDHNVYARIEPLHKLRIVNACKKDGYITAMTGDGVNDAPALEASNIGVAMGITGTDVAKEASDMILTDDNFTSIVAAVEEGRVVFNRLRNVVFFLLMTCISELFLLLLSVTFYGESPLEPIQILWINLLTGSLAAIPLGLEPGKGKELKQPPRNIRVGLIYKGMAIRLASVALTMGLLITWLYYHAPIPAGSNSYVTHETRQTIAFTSVVIFEWLFAFQARSPEEGPISLGIFKNQWLIICMFLGLCLHCMVIYLPFANTVFKTHSLTATELLWAVFPGVIAFSLESLRKMLSPKLFSAGQWKN